MVNITAEELDPYPGIFLKDDLEQKVADACQSLADTYRNKGKEEDAIETLRNVEIARTEATSKENSFRKFVELRNQWYKMMQLSAREDVREKLQKILRTNG